MTSNEVSKLRNDVAAIALNNFKDKINVEGKPKKSNVWLQSLNNRTTLKAFSLVKETKRCSSYKNIKEFFEEPSFAFMFLVMTKNAKKHIKREIEDKVAELAEQFRETLK